MKQVINVFSLKYHPINCQANVFTARFRNAKDWTGASCMLNISSCIQIWCNIDVLEQMLSKLCFSILQILRYVDFSSLAGNSGSWSLHLNLRNTDLNHSLQPCIPKNMFCFVFERRLKLSRATADGNRFDWSEKSMQGPTKFILGLEVIKTNNSQKFTPGEDKGKPLQST